MPGNSPVHHSGSTPTTSNHHTSLSQHQQHHHQQSQQDQQQDSTLPSTTSPPSNILTTTSIPQQQQQQQQQSLHQSSLQHHQQQQQQHHNPATVVTQLFQNETTKHGMEKFILQKVLQHRLTHRNASLMGQLLKPLALWYMPLQPHILSMIPRSSFCSVLGDRNDLFIFGGRTQVESRSATPIFTSVLNLDSLMTKTLQCAGYAPTDRYSAAAVRCGGAIFIFGGFIIGSNRWSNSLYSLIPTQARLEHIDTTNSNNSNTKTNSNAKNENSDLKTTTTTTTTTNTNTTTTDTNQDNQIINKDQQLPTNQTQSSSTQQQSQSPLSLSTEPTTINNDTTPTTNTTSDSPANDNVTTHPTISHSNIPQQSQQPSQQQQQQSTTIFVWSQVKSTGVTPSPRAAHTATALESLPKHLQHPSTQSFSLRRNFYIFGGNDNSKCFNELHCFDTERHKWLQTTFWPAFHANSGNPEHIQLAPISGHSTVSFANRYLISFGGMTSTANGHRSTNILSCIDTSPQFPFVLNQHTLLFEHANFQSTPSNQSSLTHSQQPLLSNNNTISLISPQTAILLRDNIHNPKSPIITSMGTVDSPYGTFPLPPEQIFVSNLPIVEENISEKPSPRSAHGMVMIAPNKAVVFGGVSVSPTGDATYFNDIYVLEFQIQIFSFFATQVGIIVNQPQLVVRYSKRVTAGDTPRPRAGMSLIAYVPPTTNTTTSTTNTPHQTPHQTTTTTTTTPPTNTNPTSPNNDQNDTTKTPTITASQPPPQQQQQQQPQQSEPIMSVPSRPSSSTASNPNKSTPQQSQTVLDDTYHVSNLVICIGGADSTSPTNEIYILDSDFVQNSKNEFIPNPNHHPSSNIPQHHQHQQQQQQPYQQQTPHFIPNQPHHNHQQSTIPPNQQYQQQQHQQQQPLYPPNSTTQNNYNQQPSHHQQQRRPSTNYNQYNQLSIHHLYEPSVRSSATIQSTTNNNYNQPNLQQFPIHHQYQQQPSQQPQQQQQPIPTPQFLPTSPPFYPTLSQSQFSQQPSFLLQQQQQQQQKFQPLQLQSPQKPTQQSPLPQQQQQQQLDSDTQPQIVIPIHGTNYQDIITSFSQQKAYELSLHIPMLPTAIHLQQQLQLLSDSLSNTPTDTNSTTIPIDNDTIETDTTTTRADSTFDTNNTDKQTTTTTSSSTTHKKQSSSSSPSQISSLQLQQALLSQLPQSSDISQRVEQYIRLASQPTPSQLNPDYTNATSNSMNSLNSTDINNTFIPKRYPGQLVSATAAATSDLILSLSTQVSLYQQQQNLLQQQFPHIDLNNILPLYQHQLQQYQTQLLSIQQSHNIQQQLQFQQQHQQQLFQYTKDLAFSTPEETLQYSLQNVIQLQKQYDFLLTSQNDQLKAVLELLNYTRLHQLYQHLSATMQIFEFTKQQLLLHNHHSKVMTTTIDVDTTDGINNNDETNQHDKITIQHTQIDDFTNNALDSLTELAKNVCLRSDLQYSSILPSLSPNTLPNLPQSAAQLLILTQQQEQQQAQQQQAQQQQLQNEKQQLHEQSSSIDPTATSTQQLLNTITTSTPISNSTTPQTTTPLQQPSLYHQPTQVPYHSRTTTPITTPDTPSPSHANK